MTNTVEALQKNELASQSEIFIYCDNAKSEKVQSSVNEVRNFVDTVDGFKKVTVIKRKKTGVFLILLQTALQKL